MTRRHTVPEVITAVCRVTGVDFGRIVGRSREHLVNHARWIIVVLARERTHASFPEIAAEMGRDSHGTTIGQHRLAKALSRFERTRVVVSYYNEPWLRKQYPDDRWEWIDCAMSKALVNQGKRDSGGAVKAPEVLIVNRRQP